MSLIIGFYVRDGIVVAADRCTTTRYENNATSHCFDTRKIVLLNERLTVLYCGEHFVDNDNKISVNEFLESCRDIVVGCSGAIAVASAIIT